MANREESARRAKKRTSDQGPGWEPQLIETLHDLLHSVDPGTGSLDAELLRLTRAYGDAVYPELIHVLSHLRFEPAEAKQHWNQILAHRDDMQQRQGSTVDLRVALVSYFVQVNRKLKNPKIIEMRLFEQTQESAYRDELTGLHNYRLFAEYLEQEISRSSRYSGPVSLVMVDIDNFKMYNDKNGHEAGNQTLATVARLLKASLRKTDFASRYGGEEFALILPATPKTGARLVAERTRATIEQHAFAYAESQPGKRLTVSMGVATYPADAKELAELIRRADRAMYIAKSNGKNQVQLYGESKRSYERIKAMLPGRFRGLEREAHALTTVNISEEGILFRSDRELAVGTFVDVTLTLTSKDEIRASGRVVHVEKPAPGVFHIAVRITDSSARAELVAYIREISSTAELVRL